MIDIKKRPIYRSISIALKKMVSGVIQNDYFRFSFNLFGTTICRKTASPIVSCPTLHRTEKYSIAMCYLPHGFTWRFPDALRHLDYPDYVLDKSFAQTHDQEFALSASFCLNLFFFNTQLLLEFDFFLRQDYKRVLHCFADLASSHCGWLRLLRRRISWCHLQSSSNQLWSD